MTSTELKQRLPIPPTVLYDDDDTDIAIVLPLYDANWKDYRENDWFVQTSLTVRNSIIKNTDAIANRIPIYFFVEDTVYDRWATRLIAEGIPPSRVRKFSSPDPTCATMVGRVSKIFYMPDDKVLMNYRNIIAWDADLFVACDPEIGKSYNLNSLKGDNIGIWGFRANLATYNSVKHYWWKWNEHKTMQSKFRKSCQELRAVMPDLAIDEQTRFSIMLGGITRFPIPLPPGFKEFALKVEPAVGDQELVIALWKLYEPSSIIDKVSIPECAWNHCESLSLRTRGVYLLHFGYDDDYTEEWESVFYPDIGLRRPSQS